MLSTLPATISTYRYQVIVVEELYGTRYQSGSFSLINVGSGFHCLRDFSFRIFFCSFSYQVTENLNNLKDRNTEVYIAVACCNVQ